MACEDSKIYEFKVGTRYDKQIFIYQIYLLILTSFFFKAEGNMEVGKLKISKIPGQKPQVSLTLSDDVLALGEEKIPKNHRLDVSVVTRQTLGVFSHMIRNLLIIHCIEISF